MAVQSMRRSLRDTDDSDASSDGADAGSGDSRDPKDTGASGQGNAIKTSGADCSVRRVQLGEGIGQSTKLCPPSSQCVIHVRDVIT
jgi:hypothetical protein